MGLVQNLKKKLNDWGDKVLVELSFLYIKHLAKQTSKKQVNSSSTEYSPNPLTKEPSAPIVEESTSEKIIMKMETEDIIAHIRNWSINTIETKKNSVEDQIAIMEEFYEWINPEDDDLEIISLEEVSEGEYNDYLEKN